MSSGAGGGGGGGFDSMFGPSTLSSPYPRYESTLDKTAVATEAASSSSSSLPPKTIYETNREAMLELINDWKSKLQEWDTQGEDHR